MAVASMSGPATVLFNGIVTGPIPGHPNNGAALLLTSVLRTTDPSGTRRRRRLR